MNAPMAAQLHTNGQYGHAQTTGIADVHRGAIQVPTQAEFSERRKA